MYILQRICLYTYSLPLIALHQTTLLFRFMLFKSVFLYRLMVNLIQVHQFSNQVWSIRIVSCMGTNYVKNYHKKILLSFQSSIINVITFFRLNVLKVPREPRISSRHLLMVESSDRLTVKKKWQRKMCLLVDKISCPINENNKPRFVLIFFFPLEVFNNIIPILFVNLFLVSMTLYYMEVLIIIAQLFLLL